MTSENQEMNQPTQEQVQENPEMTVKETAAQLTEMYLMLNREVSLKINPLTSSKLKRLHQRVAAYPLEFDKTEMSSDEQEAYDLLIKIKNLYVDLFLLSEHAKSRGIELIPKQEPPKAE